MIVFILIALNQQSFLVSVPKFHYIAIIAFRITISIYKKVTALIKTTIKIHSLNEPSNIALLVQRL